MPLEDEVGYIIHVPFEMLPEDTEAPYRATAAVAKDKESMMDSVPDGE